MARAVTQFREPALPVADDEIGQRALVRQHRADALLHFVHVIQQKELRNRIGKVLRDVENGESVTATVAGRPVAELRPANGG